MKRTQKVSLMSALLVSLLLGGLHVAAQVKDEPKKRASSFGRPQIDAVKKPVKVLDDARIVDFGKVIFQGKIDLNPTLERIRMGESLKHRNDGSTFMNREGHLPRSKDREYYREFVLKMQGVPFPGPTRVIIGKKGEVYFTGDHYDTFTRVD